MRVVLQLAIHYDLRQELTKPVDVHYLQIVREGWVEPLPEESGQRRDVISYQVAKPRYQPSQSETASRSSRSSRAVAAIADRSNSLSSSPSTMM